MEPDERSIRRLLASFAEQAGPPPPIRGGAGAPTPLTSRPTRGARWGAPVAAAVLIAGVGVGGTLLARSGNPAGRPSSGRTTGSTKEIRAVHAREFTCAAPIAGPSLSEPSYDGYTFAVESVKRTASGAPAVQIKLSSQGSRHLPDPPGPTNPQVLVLQRGILVAGQTNAPSETGPGTSPHTEAGFQERIAPVSPGHPYVRTLQPRPTAVCPGHSWNQIWAAPSEYQVVVLMSTHDLSPTPSVPSYGQGPSMPDPLLILPVPSRLFG